MEGGEHEMLIMSYENRRGQRYWRWLDKGSCEERIQPEIWFPPLLLVILIFLNFLTVLISRKVKITTSSLRVVVRAWIRIFFLDGERVQKENISPFDFTGTADNGRANPSFSHYDRNHTIKAIIKECDFEYDTNDDRHDDCKWGMQQ